MNASQITAMLHSGLKFNKFRSSKSPKTMPYNSRQFMIKYKHVCVCVELTL